VPPGWASVPVMVYDERTTPITKMPCTMVAGSVGMRLKSSAEPPIQGEPDDSLTSLDTIAIESGWWMYEGMTEEEIDLQKQSEIKTYGPAYGEMMWGDL
jgi:hypothetical protein